MINEDSTEDEIRAYVDRELMKLYRSKVTEAVVEDLPRAIVGLDCVMLDGTKFVTLEAVQAELKQRGADVPTELIEPILNRWHAEPLRMPGILGLQQ